MNKWIMVASLAIALTAFAQAKPEVTLTCPAGTKQIGGAKTFLESTACAKFARDGSRVFHGPFVAYWPDGAKQAEGQYEEGFRNGHWIFFDEKGVKTGETDFMHGNYHGHRVQFWPNGRVMMEEEYDHGRQTSLKTFDQNGAAIAPQQLGVQVRK